LSNSGLIAKKAKVEVMEQCIISLASHLVINSFQSHSPSCTFSEYRDVALHSLLSELIVWCLPGFSSEDFDQPTSLRELCLRRDKDKRAWIPQSFQVGPDMQFMLPSDYQLHYKPSPVRHILPRHQAAAMMDVVMEGCFKMAIHA